MLHRHVSYFGISRSRSQKVARGCRSHIRWTSLYIQGRGNSAGMCKHLSKYDNIHRRISLMRCFTCQVTMTWQWSHYNHTATLANHLSVHAKHFLHYVCMRALLCAWMQCLTHVASLQQSMLCPQPTCSSESQLPLYTLHSAIYCEAWVNEAHIKHVVLAFAAAAYIHSYTL